MSTLFGRLGFRNRRNKLITGTVFSAVAAALVAGAIVYPGFKTTDVDLNDGGVWVVSKARNAVGRLNYPSRVLDGAVTPASTTFDVLQNAGRVFVDDESGSTLNQVSAANMRPGLSFAPGSSNAASGLYFNSGTDTAVTTKGLSKGDSYSVQVSDPVKLEHGQLTQYDFAKATLPDVSDVPPVVGAQANDLSSDAPTAVDQVRQIEAHFQKKGAFSNGLIADGQLQSVSGHSAARIRDILTAKQMLGDDEQYAVAMSLMLRHLGIPSRVVMGFYPDPKSPENGAGEVRILGKDVHAWVEVAFDRVGWVAFDPTPPKDNIPIPPDPENKSKPKPQVLQPPPPPQEPADLPPDSSPEALDADEKKNNPWLFWGPILSAIGIALVPVAILALPLLLIALLKLRLRKTRFTDGHPAQRVGGGWNEVLSLATDMGAALDSRATRRESAAVVAEAFPAASSTTTLLAHRADASIFGAGRPSEEDVREYWTLVDGSLKEMTGTAGFWRRQQARFSQRSLLADARSGLNARSARNAQRGSNLNVRGLRLPAALLPSAILRRTALRRPAAKDDRGRPEDD